jgi:hypothetical protein
VCSGSGGDKHETDDALVEVDDLGTMQPVVLTNSEDIDKFNYYAPDAVAAFVWCCVPFTKNSKTKSDKYCLVRVGAKDLQPTSVLTHQCAAGYLPRVTLDAGFKARLAKTNKVVNGAFVLDYEEEHLQVAISDWPSRFMLQLEIGHKRFPNSTDDELDVLLTSWTVRLNAVWATMENPRKEPTKTLVGVLTSNFLKYFQPRTAAAMEKDHAKFVAAMRKSSTSKTRFAAAWKRAGEIKNMFDERFVNSRLTQAKQKTGKENADQEGDQEGDQAEDEGEEEEEEEEEEEDEDDEAPKKKKSKNDDEVDDDDDSDDSESGDAGSEDADEKKQEEDEQIAGKEKTPTTDKAAYKTKRKNDDEEDDDDDSDDSELSESADSGPEVKQKKADKIKNANEEEEDDSADSSESDCEGPHKVVEKGIDDSGEGQDDSDEINGHAGSKKSFKRKSTAVAGGKGKKTKFKHKNAGGKGNKSKHKRDAEAGGGSRKKPALTTAPTKPPASLQDEPRLKLIDDEAEEASSSELSGSSESEPEPSTKPKKKKTSSCGCTSRPDRNHKS